VQRVNPSWGVDYTAWHWVGIVAHNPVARPSLLDILGERRWCWLKSTPGGLYWVRWSSRQEPSRFQLIFEREEDAALFSLVWGD